MSDFNMKKALVISNKIRKIPGGAIETVVNPLKERGYDVVWAANFSTLKVPIEQFPCEVLKTTSQTNPFSKGSIKTRKTIQQYLKNNKVDLIFCSTPVGGFNGRLCGKKAKVDKVIYEAHGFLFFKGGPKLGFFYKSIEKWLAKYTDTIITINHEDFENAKKFKIKNRDNVFLVNGSGEDYQSDSISNEEKQSLRKSLDIEEKDFVFISIGELNKNKNVLSSVKAFYKAFSNNKNVKMLICGEGKQDKTINAFINKRNLSDQIKLLGYRTDVRKLLQISNCYVSTSLREGLSRTVGESMAASLPCIVSNKRGLRDWIDDKESFTFEPKNIKQISECMLRIYNSKDLKQIGDYNKNKVKEYSSEHIIKQFNDIFDKILN